MDIALIILALIIVYGLVLWGLVLLIRKLGVPSKWAILVAFLTFAVGTGVWVIQISHLDSSVLVNYPAIFLGDFIYHWSIQLLGDPHSFWAHETIPWLLRTPQVYLIASIMIWGLLGLVVQLIFNYRRKRASGSRSHGISGARVKEESL
ncbi:MAG: hypothetical protein A2Y90_00230 [Chloroflexi bacterium RBG_13_52_12]|nr:MAG: hypothetical protein A2Y90_00230 [Chloroflexi bacterium RBG_13_52_12]